MWLIDLFKNILMEKPAPAVARRREPDREGTHLSYEHRVWVQRKLKAIGLYQAKLYRDFVPALIRAVEAFQRIKRLEVDGIVGPLTWAQLAKTPDGPLVIPTGAGEAAWYRQAMKDYGLKEIPGPAHNPRVVEMFAKAGHSWVKDDETAWCAAAMNCWMVESGWKGTGLLTAQSFLKWGREHTGPVETGVVCVFKRGTKAWQGHVTLATGRRKPGYIECLGGNQKNAVGKDWYAEADLLGMRWPTERNA